MSNFATLKAAIADVIKTNGTNAITGALLQQSLFAMINSLGANFQFAGFADSTTNPGTPDQNVFYLAGSPGAYSNFGLTVNNGELAALTYNGTWAKITLSTDFVFLPLLDKNLFLGYPQRLNDKIVLYSTTSYVGDYPGYYCHKIKLAKNTTYYIPVFSNAAYNGVVANSANESYSNLWFTFGGTYKGSGVTVSGGKMSFTTPNNDDVYLCVNLYLGGSFNLNRVPDFYITTDSTFTSGQNFVRDDINIYAAFNALAQLGGANSEIGALRLAIDALTEKTTTPLNDKNLFVGVSQRVNDTLVLYQGGTAVVGPFAGYYCYKIKLAKNTTYYMPRWAGAGHSAYNALVGKYDGTKYDGYYFIGNGVNAIGANITAGTTKFSFTTPNNDDVYLFVNVHLPGTRFNLTDLLPLFYVTADSSFTDGQKFTIEDENLDILRFVLSGTTGIEQQVIANTAAIANHETRIDALEQESENPYGGKVICFLGDSITWLALSANPERGWVTHFLQKLTFASSRNYAYSGAILSNYTDSAVNPTGYWGSPAADNIVFNQIKRLANDIANGATVPDYIMILAGTNDTYMYNTTSESFAERHAQISQLLADTAADVFEAGDNNVNYYNTKTPAQCNTLAKALRLIGDALITICPNAQVVITTPLQSAFFTETQQQQVATLIKDCARYLSWNVIDQGHDAGISRLQESKGYRMTYDGTHTSELGANFVAGFLAAKVKSIFRK